MRTLVLALVLACLTAPGSALAQGRTLGSRLDKTPNAFGCETEPMFTDQSYDGAYRLRPSDDPDCTWFQAGVEGDPSNPLTGAVPGDGRITSVTVRSGHNPAPLRFVIITNLAAKGGGSACCYFRSETEPMQPRPDDVTTFPVNLPVQNNAEVQTYTRRTDYVGVSAARGAGSLPLFTNGRNNTLTDSGPGSLQAAFYYPRLQRSDQASSRNPSGIPGIEVLLQFTWCPGAAGALAAQGCLVQGAPLGGASVVGSRLRARRGRVGLRVRCLLATTCKGRASLRTRGTTAAAKARALGSKRFKIPSGKTRTVKIKLNRRGRKLARRRRAKVVAVVALGKAGATKKNMTLRR